MPKPTTLTPLEKSTILQHKDKLLNLRLFKKIKNFLNTLGIEKIDQTELYDLLFNSSLKNCNNSKFVSFSVGYRACEKGCECYLKNLSNKISTIKSTTTVEQQKEINEKRKQTTYLKYGVENVFALDDIKEKSKQTKKLKYGDENYRNDQKIIETNIKKYGVDNPMKSTEIRELYYKDFILRDFAASVRKAKQTKKLKYGDENYRNDQKIIETNIKKYGVDNPSKSLVVQQKISKNLRSTLYDRTVERYSSFIKPLFDKEKYLNGLSNSWECVRCQTILTGSIINGIIPRCQTCFPYSISKFELEVRDFLKTLVNPDLLIFNDRTLISPQELDIVIPSKHLAFECNGAYRHCENSGLKYRNYHLNKSTNATKSGYSLMHILDVDWYHSQNIVKSMIKHKLGLSTRIGARKTRLVTLTHDQAIKFFNSNHLQGGIPARITYGLLVQDQIVAAMSFSKSRYTTDATWEIIRFCNKNDHVILGAASKLLTHFRKNHSGSILTYADRSFGSTNFYEEIGFSYLSASPPGYRYYKDGLLFSRIQFQKHKLSNLLQEYDPNKSEWENMQNNGFDRLWDCGNSIFVLK